MGENFEYKSDAFSMLLQNPEYALDVYNTMNDSDYRNPKDLDIYLLESGISLSIRNDASFIIYNHLCVYEHQGSYNPNMAVRELIYFVSLITRLIKEKRIDVYGRKKIKLPRPQFVVFYNGLEERPEREIFRLSDLFEEGEDEPQIELVCEAININPNKNTMLKKKSYVLDGYCTFVEKVRKCEQEGMTLMDALDKAVKECIDEHVLEEFFRERGDEVKKVTVLDFTFERRIELATRDAMLEGEARGEARGEACGRTKDILMLLEEVGIIPAELEKKIRNQKDSDTLSRWIKLAAKAESIEDFKQKISEE